MEGVCFLVEFWDGWRGSKSLSFLLWAVNAMDFGKTCGVTAGESLLFGGVVIDPYFCFSLTQYPQAFCKDSGFKLLTMPRESGRRFVSRHYTHCVLQYSIALVL